MKPETIQKIDSLIETWIVRGDIPGAAIRITQNGAPVHVRAFGFARKFAYPGEPIASPEPMTASHLFDLGSLTKGFATTFAAMLAVDAGEIALDDAVHAHLPDFARDGHREITIRQLLNHTSGMIPWKPLYFHERRREHLLNLIASIPLESAAGSRRRYSDLGFMALGFLLERVGGSRLDELLESRLYSKLGLRRTLFNPLRSGATRIAATSHGNPFEQRMVTDPGFGHPCDERIESFDGWRRRTLQGEANDGNAFHSQDGVAGHAGLFSDAADLSKLLQVLLDDGSFEGSPLLSPETVRAFLKKDAQGLVLGWSSLPGCRTTDALGIENPPSDAFGHPGFTGTYAYAVPSKRTSLIFLTNRQNAGAGPDGRYANLKPLQAELAELMS